MNIFDQTPKLADSGAVMQVLDLRDEPIEGVSITLLGKDSKVYQSITRKRQQAALDRAAKGRNATKLDAEKLAEDSIDDLVKLTVSWEGIADASGVMECTPENVRRLYTEVPHVREQVDAFIGDRANFLSPAPNS